MNYEQQILKILIAVGQRGLSLAALTKHVYNMNASFFEQPDLQEVADAVRQCVRRLSARKQPLLERAGRRGWYRLSVRQRAVAQQMMFDFNSSESAEADAPCGDASRQDYSLSLFDLDEQA